MGRRLPGRLYLDLPRRLPGMDTYALPPFLRYRHSLPAKHGHGMTPKGANLNKETSTRGYHLVIKESGPGVGSQHEEAPPQDHA